MAINTDTVAKSLVQRIEDASKEQLQEHTMVRKASTDLRRQSVIAELRKIDLELARYPQDRLEIEKKMGTAFKLSNEFGQILKEASIQALGALGGKWATFYAALGL